MRRLGWILGALLLGAPAQAALRPSPELGFRAEVAPDSILVGDPITLRLEASAPSGTTLLLPTAADSIGPFTVLDAAPPVTATKDGRLRVSRQIRLTLFRTGAHTLPPLPLLAPQSGGDTLVAWSTPVTVRVGSVLQGKLDPSRLKELKKPVALARSLWWVWVAGAVIVGVGVWWLLRWWRHRRRSRGEAAAPAPPPLPPEIAFERGLAALRAQRLPERGQVREYYFELSMLFRRYLEDRFAFSAVEETRTEILERAARLSELAPEEIESLGAWLDEGDLVKFAKMERLLQEAEVYAERASTWVQRTAERRLPPSVPPGVPPAAPPAVPKPAPAGTPPAGEEVR